MARKSSKLPVPVGWTSQEGSESNTKFTRRFHTSHTRKTSQEDTMSDLFNRLKDISDPVVVSYSKEKRNNKSIFQKTWQGYLKKCLNPKNLKMVFLKMTLSHSSIFLCARMSDLTMSKFFLHLNSFTSSIPKKSGLALTNFYWKTTEYYV